MFWQICFRALTNIYHQPYLLNFVCRIKNRSHYNINRWMKSDLLTQKERRRSVCKAMSFILFIVPSTIRSEKNLSIIHNLAGIWCRMSFYFEGTLFRIFHRYLIHSICQHHFSISQNCYHVMYFKRNITFQKCQHEPTIWSNLNSNTLEIQQLHTHMTYPFYYMLIQF